MSRARQHAGPGRLALLLAGLLGCAAPVLAQRLEPPQRAGAVLDRPLRLQATQGDRAVGAFTVTHPGRIRIQAVWTGSARNLAMILNGPGQTGYYARRDGGSPLVVDFDVGEAEMSRGRGWRVSLVNFGGGTASGHLLVEYPGRPAIVLHPVEPRPTPGPDTTRSAETERTILPDGTVEIRYPDGTIRRQRMGACGYTIIRPDGTAMTVACEQVQREAVPDLPADLLARDDLGAVLDAVATNLLDDIRAAVKDEGAVNNYLALEQGKTLQDRIFLRLEALSVLAR